MANTDVLEWLRKEHVCDGHLCGHDHLMRDAADEIERLRAEVRELRIRAERWEALADSHQFSMEGDSA